MNPHNPIPIFIISFNRGHYLRSIIDSYNMQDIPVDIIIHDNGSDEASTIDILTTLEQEAITINRLAKILEPDQLDNVQKSVEKYNNEKGYSGPYVVTDCDVDLSISDTGSIRTYLYILSAIDDVDCVGPMLKISDIPKSYPLFNRVMTRHIEQFWRHEPEWMDSPSGRVGFIRQKIDTTFAVHRGGAPFRRLKDGVRVYHPFEARHLDWYVRSNDIDGYRSTSSSMISHWNNEEELIRYANDAEVSETYIIVEGPREALRETTLHTRNNPD